jgi:hypothetical protein
MGAPTGLAALGWQITDARHELVAATLELVRENLDFFYPIFSKARILYPITTKESYQPFRSLRFVFDAFSVQNDRIQRLMSCHSNQLIIFFCLVGIFGCFQAADQGDVQTCVAVVAVLGPLLVVPQRRRMHWFFSYIELLQRFQLWTAATVLNCPLPPHMFLLFFFCFWRMHVWNSCECYLCIYLISRTSQLLARHQRNSSLRHK